MSWLVPATGPVNDHLAATIGRLAVEHQAPRFPPHITLTSTVSAAEQVAVRALRPVAASMPPFEVTFTAIGHEPACFRCLYLRAEPSPQLAALHQSAQQAWSLNEPLYQPHLSLLYSDLAEQRKQPIIDTIGICLPLTIRIDALELWAGHGQQVRRWHRIIRMPLPASQQGTRTPSAAKPTGIAPDPAPPPASEHDKGQPGPRRRSGDPG
jgi:2'-5' RNA ligase